MLMDMEKNEEEKLEEILRELSAEYTSENGVEEVQTGMLEEQEDAFLEETAAVLRENEADESITEDTVKEAPKPKKNRKLPIILGAAVLAVAVAVFVLTQFVFVAGNMYSVRSETLDLRGEELTEEDFLELAERMPQCQITWDVPFQDGKVDSSSAEISVTSLTEEDIRILDYVTGLEMVQGTGCDDYAQLAQLQLHRENVEVLYSVPVAGNSYPQDTQELVLESFTAEDAALLPALLQLNKVAISNCDDYALLQQLQAEQPQWNLTYTVAVGDETFPWDSEEILAKNVTAEELTVALTGLPMLKKMDMVNPVADYEALNTLREQYANVKLNWTVELFGQTFAEDTKEIDISGNLVENCADVEKLVACLPNLEKLIMSDCGIDSETMAEYRERQRANYKVVWTVYLGEICKVRTDEIFFHPIQQGEYYLWDEDTPELKYCEDMICVDVGHHKIRNIDFCRYMPHLKYLILAHTLIRDVSALVGCQELIFLEVNWSELRDYSPLVELKALEDLNLHRTYADITPLLEMPWLKNLWVPGRSYQERQRLIAALPDTNLELNTDNTRGWRHLPNYYDMRDVLGMRYMTQ